MHKWASRWDAYRYEIEEELRETKDELAKSAAALLASQKENQSLMKDAALTKVYRDELDSFYEKVSKLMNKLSECSSQFGIYITCSNSSVHYCYLYLIYSLNVLYTFFCFVNKLLGLCAFICGNFV